MELTKEKTYNITKAEKILPIRRKLIKTHLGRITVTFLVNKTTTVMKIDTKEMMLMDMIVRCFDVYAYSFKISF